MRFYNRWWKAIRGLSLTDEKAWNPSLWNLLGSQSLSGETVTEQTALTYSAVWCAVNLISGLTSSFPLNLMQRSKDARRIADDRKVYWVMHDTANPYMTAKRLRQVLMAHVLTWGNGYAEIVRDNWGEVIELWPITPNRVKMVFVDGAYAYEIRIADGTDVILKWDRVLHVPGLGYDGFQGYSVIAMARKSMGLGMAMETFGSKYFGSGTQPGLVITHPSKLSPQASDNLRKSLADSYAGLGNAHRMMLLEEGMKPEKLGIPPNDSQFLESRQFQVSEIARWFNLPPHKLKDLTKSSFSNIESEQISFMTESILEWLITLEQEYNLRLLTKTDKDLSGRGRYYFKHNFDSWMRGDSASRAAFYSTMLDKGVFSINEVRELEDKDPVDGGDIHLVPLNMTTLENAGQPPEPTPAPTPEPQPEPAPVKQERARR